MLWIGKTKSSQRTLQQISWLVGPLVMIQLTVRPKNKVKFKPNYKLLL